MPSPLTAEKILALAPDASAAKAGKGLAAPSKWVSLGADERATWGECKGSGASPYRTKIDLAEIAFDCSCPSRKLPCKHSLGLFLLLEAEPARFGASAQPEWVAEWLDGRAKRREQKAARAAKEDAPADPAAKAKRAASRQAKVAAGVAELELWLRDLARTGLASAHGRPASFWEATAARMVDGQAPGLARLLREAAGVPDSGPGWQDRLLVRLGRLHLLVEGYKRLDTLPPEMRADVLANVVGSAQDDLSAEPAVRDAWLVLGWRDEDDGRIRARRTWARGRTTGRAALVTSFAHGTAAFDSSLVPGTVADADLVFFPGAWPLRALVREHNAAPESMDATVGAATATEALAEVGAALARAPWIERLPLSLASVVPARRDAWVVVDGEGRSLPLSSRFDGGWRLLALGGGRPVGLFGEWDGESLLPLSAWAEGRFVAL